MAPAGNIETDGEGVVIIEDMAEELRDGDEATQGVLVVVVFDTAHVGLLESFERVETALLGNGTELD